MLTRIKLRHFRCFAQFETEFAPGTTVITGGNARGKTSLLEAAAVLLLLGSPRTASLGEVVQHGQAGFVTDGYYAGRHLQFYWSARRKKLALDGVEQRKAAEYLQLGRLVWFANEDIRLVRGAAEERRRFLDFVLRQIAPAHRLHLRAYERALRSRNALLKGARLNWRAIGAFDEPLARAGEELSAARAALVARLAPLAAEMQAAIGAGETLALTYERGHAGALDLALGEAREEDARLRQTTVGPHRDEVRFEVNGRGSEFASEGQQRSLALALRLAQARLLAREAEQAPLLLLDDIFGELDCARRHALLAHLPADSQRLITTTNLAWLADGAEFGRLEL